MRKSASTNFQNEQAVAQRCPITATFNLLGSRWKLMILWNVGLGNTRFSLLKKALTGISEKVLSRQLKELEKTGFLVRTVYAEVPPHVEYRLTKTGESFIPILQQVGSWAKENGILEQYQSLLEKSTGVSIRGVRQ